MTCSIYRAKYPDLNAAAESPSNEPPNPLLGPQCSGANNAPLGSRQSRAEDFLTSLEGALLYVKQPHHYRVR